MKLFVVTFRYKSAGAQVRAHVKASAAEAAISTAREVFGLTLPDWIAESVEPEIVNVSY